MSRKNTFQYKQTISVNRETFMDKVVLNKYLNKKELRVLLHLLTHLDSLTAKEVSITQMSEDLNISKKDIKEAIEVLVLNELLETLTTGSVKNGLRLLF